jgi:hypothetical protein
VWDECTCLSHECSIPMGQDWGEFWDEEIDNLQQGDGEK